MDLQTLRVRLAASLAKAKAVCDAADKENQGVMTEAQAAEFDAASKEAEQIKAEIDRRIRLGEMANDATASTGRQTAAQVDTVRVSGGDANNPDKDTTAGFRDVADFAACVYKAARKTDRVVDERLSAMQNISAAPSNFHRETGSSDGYMVPPSFRNEIWELVFEDHSLLGDVDSEPTDGNQVQLMTDQTTPWGSSGVQAYWGAEGTQFTASRLATAFEDVKLHKMHAMVLATEELLEDAPRMANRLTKKAAQAIAWKATEAVIYGDGVGKPLGYFSSAALVSVAKETGQSAATLVALNIAKMYSRLLDASVSRAFWLMNSDTVPQLATLSLGNNLLWTPPNSGFAGAPGGYLMGRPIRFNEHCKTLGTKGDIQLIDPKGYYLPTKSGGVKFAQSVHLYFDYDIQAFKWTFRIGGQPYLSAPVSPANGSNTKSHFVTLDTRS